MEADRNPFADLAPMESYREFKDLLRDVALRTRFSSPNEIARALNTDTDLVVGWFSGTRPQKRKGYETNYNEELKTLLGIRRYPAILGRWNELYAELGRRPPRMPPSPDVIEPPAPAAVETKGLGLLPTQAAVLPPVREDDPHTSLPVPTGLPEQGTPAPEAASPAPAQEWLFFVFDLKELGRRASKVLKVGFVPVVLTGVFALSIRSQLFPDAPPSPTRAATAFQAIVPYQHVRLSKEGFVLPDSSTRGYSVEEIRALKLTPWESYIARNEMHARHGYLFVNPNSQCLQAHFDRYRDGGGMGGWYRPNLNFRPEFISDLEYRNIAAMKLVEREAFGRYIDCAWPID